jgi:hypothetical protein
VATDFSVFIKRGAEFDFLGKYNGPPVFDLEFDHINRKILAATWGRGVMSFPLDSFDFSPNSGQKIAAVRVRNVQNLPVPDVEIIDFSKKTNLAGMADFNTIACENSIFKIKKSDNPLSGVDIFDLVKLSRHVLNIEPFTQNWQFIAADVNASKLVTTSDIVDLRKVLLGILPNFPNNSSWRFHPENHVWSGNYPAAEPLPDSLSQFIFGNIDTTFFDFRGIKIGDINGDGQPLSAVVSDKKTTEIFADDRFFSKNEVFETEFFMSTAGISAAQFSMDFDKNLVKILSIEPIFDAISTENLNLGKMKNGRISAAFFWENTFFDISQKLFKIRFRALADGQISQAVRLENLPTKSAVFSPQGAENQLVINFKNHFKNDDFQIFPNPVSGDFAFLKMSFFSKKTIEIECFDIGGKFIFSEKNINTSTENHPIPTEKLPENGIYFLQIRVSENELPVVLKFIYYR